MDGQSDRQNLIPHPAQLPAAWRWLLTVFVLVIGLGYVAALVNLVGQNELNDTRKGLSADDLVFRYHGAYVEAEAGEPAPSRLLQQIDGSMRKNFEDDAGYQIVRQWIVSGASEESMRTGPQPTPAAIIERDCLICHAANSGEDIAKTSDFGPTDTQIDFAKLSRFAVVEQPGAEKSWQPPVNWRSLALTTHAHLLSVPVFLSLLAVIFLWGGACRGHGLIRGILAAGPLVFFALEVICWWLARIPDVGYFFALAIGATGACFGATFTVQWFLALLSIWKSSEPHA
ncbi:MAG: hypothetical protein ACYTHJ_13815 [Planctomycetota bacterium]|jgi:hypothetical protein